MTTAAPVHFRYLFHALTTNSSSHLHHHKSNSISSGFGFTSGNGDGGDSVAAFLSAFSRLGIILAYFYVCDRTNFFMKENK